ncbi:MAG: hypothetical protein HFG88_05140 [Dorea sp.]|nr:hypothetical protein [Dorea sp.]
MNILGLINKIFRKVLVYINYKISYASHYKIEGRIKNSENMLFVLAGYKEFLWDDIFLRIKLNQLENMEVCIASSGRYCDRLSQICKRNNWVYLSTSLNNVCVITNIIMKEFKEAEYIFKLDEDIFIPRDYFKDMLNAYKIIEKEEPCNIGYICPVLPLGFYSMHEFLLKKNCLNEYEQKFGIHKKGGSVSNPIFRKKMGIDEFIWNKIGIFDECALEYKEEGFSYEACASRTGIAAILFTRQFWDDLGYLKRGRGIGVGNTGDEGQITTYCALNFYFIFCVKNVLVGHFAFGGSENNVLKLKYEKPEIFAMKD